MGARDSSDACLSVPEERFAMEYTSGERAEWGSAREGRPKKLRWNEGDGGVTNPGLFSVCEEMLRRERPDLYGLGGAIIQKLLDLLNRLSARDRIKEQLWLGSIGAALVVSTNPGRVAAYSRELDCVAMLGYSSSRSHDLGLQEGSRLLTVNYHDRTGKHADLDFGPRKSATCTWTGFHPIIADFLTEDHVRLAERKKALPEPDWQRTEELGYDKLQYAPGAWRAGRPLAAVPTV
jgi:hypothetical protein